MNEFTIERKAKAYDEAIKRAKALYDNDQPISGSNVIINNIFPELKESENERIRKELIKFVKVNIPNEERYIAWLEKQKTIDVLDKEEREFADNVDSYRKEVDAAYQKGYNEGVKATLEKQSEPNPYTGVSFEYNGNTWGMCARDGGVEILMDGELKAFVSLEKSFVYPIHPQPELAPKSALEAIKEEKVDNANKVEPKFKVGDRIYLRPEYRMPNDDTPIADTIHEIIAIDDKHYRFEGSFIFIEDQDKFELVEQKSAWSEEDTFMYNKIKNLLTDISLAPESRNSLFVWLKSLKDRVQPQPSKEWSKEDERNLNDAILFIETGTYSLDKDNLINWLKSLIPQKQWKPSDKDIMCIDNLIAIIENRGYPDYVEYLEKLKYRIQWKPSDEQMNDLKKAIDSFTFEPDYLQELYEDLKKLREE